MKVAILDDYQDVVRHLDCFDLLVDHDVLVLTETYPEEVLAAKLADVEAVVLIRERTVITESLLSKLPKLRLISQTGKISHHLNQSLCQKYGVDIAEGIGSPVAPAELCWALIMAASRHIPAYAAQLQNGHWQCSDGRGLGRTLNGLTLGIWGYGKIGRRVAQYARAFEMKVLVWGSEGSRLAAVQDGFSAAESKAAFFSTADIVTLHLRLNDTTRGCVTSADLQLMKADALFVNTSRSDLVETGALYAEMQAHPGKQAAIDVYDVEPATPANEPLLSLPNVTALPHLGYVERNSYELYFSTAFENVVAYAQGQPKNLVTIETV
ncbi:D-2-hydroxyacid dehydrogenase family protein [Gynuella sunshinyii]|uniref:Phosphoglycerate dehydrogenase and related dehydrogenase n=1 Tax=Gynuella sunshinyii YC6258 TaxID=1445510 RepID=A0A0C5VTV8_9GAMM|nr:D-2-hydroxyacid dehydrogenase family protein [Gynuella sunshinyii]AJQ93759.1 phosphoglycerate dehydrogenase and related dehydrogenase [Gynuella sunshinyii YC6258]